VNNFFSFLVRNKDKLILLAFFSISLLVTLILFGATLRGDFVLDDHSVVEMRSELHSLKNLKEIFFLPWHPEAPWAGNYRPLIMISYAINFFFSAKPAWFHVVNLFFHALNVVLIYLIVTRFSSKKTALLSAVIFMFLPIHVEPVASIVGRSDIMGATFLLWSLLLFFDKKYWWSSLVFFFALLAKDFSIAFLPLIGVLLLIETRSFWKSFKKGLYYIVPLPFYFFCRYIALGKYAFGGYGYIDKVIGPLAFASLKERIFTGFVHFFFYLRKSFYPVDLSPDYSYNQIPTVSNILHSYQAIIGLAIFCGLIYLIFRGKKEIKISSALLLVPFAVMSNIFFVTTGTFAERWWYFPSFGFGVLIAQGLSWLKYNLDLKFKSRKLLEYSLIATLAGAVLFWYSILIFKLDKIWLDDRVLYMYSAEKSPNSVGARTNAAAIYMKEKQFNKARQEINAAVAIYDKNPATLNILGKLYWRDGDYKRAEDVFKKGIESDTRQRNYRNFYRLLAFMMMDQGRNAQALDYMKQVVNAPAYGLKENVVKTDVVLYQIIAKFQGRTIRSYSKDEINTLVAIIKLVSGF